ncbi:MAG: tripartite tricarboxylate transporter substrate binding protein [Rhodobacteraceae bacterium]|nr:tripartite tricarboxylate transporter substrate binding protein [Paracoccaceae bacterium]
MKRTLLAAALTVAALSSTAAIAQGTFPSKDITIIVQYGAGGGTDSFVRALEQPLEKAFGVNVAVRNVSGGGGAVGMMQALAKDPDGYTVTIPNNAFYTLVGMGNVPFQIEDFDYIAALVLEPYVLTVRKSDDWTDLDSFVAYAKDHKVRLGFAGVGSSTHIMTIAAAKALGLDVQFVPYGGAAEASAAALGGHIEGVVLSPSDVVSAVQGDGGLVPLVSTGESALLENVPTFTDKGYDLTVQQWRGIAAPAGVDPAVIAAWENALKQAVSDPTFQEAAANLGTELRPLFGDDLRAFVENGAAVMLPLTQEVAAQQ